MYTSTPILRFTQENQDFLFDMRWEMRKCLEVDEAFARVFFLRNGILPRCNKSSCPHCRMVKCYRQENAVNEVLCQLGIVVHTLDTYALCLPYFGLHKTSRTKADKAFRTWLRRAGGDVTFLRSVEDQQLLHVNYLLFSLKPLDTAAVVNHWWKICNKHQERQRTPSQGDYEANCKITDDEGVKKWTRYLLKTHSTCPETFTPKKDDVRVPIRKANNWARFWKKKQTHQRNAP